MDTGILDIDDGRLVWHSQKRPDQVLVFGRQARGKDIVDAELDQDQVSVFRYMFT